MQPHKIDKAFLDYLAAKKIERSTRPKEAVLAMLGFYRDWRAEGCDLANDEDMLLFQWGIYDWGDGKHLEVDITRQVMLPDEEDDDAIWQLHLTYRRPAEEADRKLGIGNEWCANLEELAAFETFVTSSAAYAELDPNRPGAKVDIGFECAG